MSEQLEARQARHATPAMTTHHGPVVPPGREMRPKPIKPEPDAKPALSQNAQMVLSQLDHNGPQLGVDLSKATGLAQGSVSTALKALRAAGEVTSKRTSPYGGAVINTSTAWATKEVEVEVKRRKDDERFDEKRADRIGREGNIGYPDTENDLEDDDEALPPAALDDHPDYDCDSGAAMAASNDPEKPDGSAGHANLARKFLSLAGMNIDRLEAAAQGGIQPLPANDYRIEAMRRLVPMVSDDIGEAINDLIEHVTGKGVA